MSLIQKPNKSHFWFPPANSNVFFFLSLVSTLLLLLPYATAQAPPSPNPNNPYGFNANFNPSMAIIIIVLISAFFFMGFFSIYIRQCAGDRSNPSVRPTNGPLGRSRRAQKGLDPTIIETFPTFIYSVVKGLKIGKGTLECAVCLNEFEDDETLRLLPKCDHVFHPECIDAWLVSHVTCPVCRANLVPDSTSAETSSSARAPDSESEFDNENETSDATNPPNQVSITVTDQPDVINPSEIPFQNRPARSRSTRRGISGKFPRSHSTGHSVIQPGENCERFTLRLPDDIRKKIVNGKLNRTASCLTFPTGYDAGGSSRRGYRGGSVNEGSSRGKYNKFWRLDSKAKSDRWVFSMAPPFVSRTGSVRRDDGEGEGSSRGSRFLTSVKSFKIKNSMDCLSGKVDGNEASTSSSSRPPV